jgi:hypothetical protein
LARAFKNIFDNPIYLIKTDTTEKAQNLTPAGILTPDLQMIILFHFVAHLLADEVLEDAARKRVRHDGDVVVEERRVRRRPSVDFIHQYRP